MRYARRAFGWGLLCGVPAVVWAGEIEPRAYVNTPVGVSFLLAGYSHAQGGLATEASSPLQDAELENDFHIGAYAHSFDFFGKSAKVDLILPYAELSGSASVAGQPREREVSGWCDPRLRFSVNFIGAPALTVKEFAGYQQDLIVGASVQISAPWGQYDSDRLVNLGSNRWFVKPDLGISKAWGDFVVELSSGVFLFDDNDDFMGGQRMERDPLYTSQLHLSYGLGRGVWVAVSGVRDVGGRSTLEGVARDDRENNSRIGATLALPLNRYNSIKLFASKGDQTRMGSDYDMFGIMWQHRWGGGL